MPARPNDDRTMLLALNRSIVRHTEAIAKGAPCERIALSVEYRVENVESAAAIPSPDGLAVASSTVSTLRSKLNFRWLLG